MIKIRTAPVTLILDELATSVKTKQPVWNRVGTNIPSIISTAEKMAQMCLFKVTFTLSGRTKDTCMSIYMYILCIYCLRHILSVVLCFLCSTLGVSLLYVWNPRFRASLPPSVYYFAILIVIHDSNVTPNLPKSSTVYRSLHQDMWDEPFCSFWHLSTMAV